jgi:hypothetical protein
MNRLPIPKKPNQRKRLKTWESWIKLFKETTILKEKYPFSFILNAAWLLNDFYWRIADQYIRPILSNTNESKHLINQYKIISASEITVMMVMPVEVKNNPEIEKLANAHFALFIATEIIKNWKIGANPPISDKTIKNLCNYHEPISENEKSPMSCDAEHLVWLSELKVTIEKPIFINAQYWRLFYIACLSMENKGKLI